MCSSDHPDVVMVSYQSRARRCSPKSGDGAGAEQDRLAILLGRGRASVLRALTTPATTTGLATTLGLAASTVSEHLAGCRRPAS